MPAAPKIFCPAEIRQQDETTINEWLESETNQMESSVSKAYLLFALLLPMFIYLDMHHSTSNPSLFYAASHRGLPALFFGLSALLMFREWRPFDIYTGIFHKGMGLTAFYIMIFLQLNYTSTFPDRLGLYPPLMMSLAVFIYRLSPRFTITWALLEVITWLWFFQNDLEALKTDANFQLFGFILAITYSNYTTTRAKIFITSRQRERALYERNEFLMEKEHLLKVVCHDIGNPLNVVTGCIHLMEMENPNFSDDAQEAWVRLKKATGNINQILCDVREVAAASNQKIQLDLQPVSLVDVIEKSVHQLNHRIEEKNLTVSITNEASPTALVDADPTKLGNHIVDNLLTNAIKFSFPGEKIDLILSESEQGVSFCVRDYGTGIPRDLQQVLFDPNAHTNRTGTDGEKGTGFGLPIVKLYVEKHLGQIEVSSKNKEEFPLNHGTSFSVTLPRAE